jgi:cytidylate kinase
LSELVIAIDGPAGAGKSTIAKAIAKKLGLTYLDTGAMYRALALKMQRASIALEDQALIAKTAFDTQITFQEGDILLDGEDVSHLIRTPEIAELASAISVYPEVRQAILNLLEELVAKKGVVLEGRDTTTAIAPSAPIRIFLTASLEERARRRHKELIEKDPSIALEEIQSQIEQRDYRDTNRPINPLVKADGVIEIMSDHLTIDQVVKQIENLVLKWNQSY